MTSDVSFSYLVYGLCSGFGLYFILSLFGWGIGSAIKFLGKGGA